MSVAKCFSLFAPIKSTGLVSFVKKPCSICRGGDAETAEERRRPGWLTLGWAAGQGLGGRIAKLGISEPPGGLVHSVGTEHVLS